MMNLEVRSIMTKDPVTAHPNQSIDDLSQFFFRIPTVTGSGSRKISRPDHLFRRVENLQVQS